MTAETRYLWHAQPDIGYLLEGPSKSRVPLQRNCLECQIHSESLDPSYLNSHGGSMPEFWVMTEIRRVVWRPNECIYRGKTAYHAEYVGGIAHLSFSIMHQSIILQISCLHWSIAQKLCWSAYQFNFLYTFYGLSRTVWGMLSLVSPPPQSKITFILIFNWHSTLLDIEINCPKKEMQK